MNFTNGSLFDGSGGFPLAAFMCGGIPVWASEVEPYPIAVTKTRFPHMKHLGSVTDIKGNEVEPVDLITFGSPCQDLSVAGKRAGLKHTDNGDEETTRSGLFMEAVRIIKEMREATNGTHPRFALWENVPGAFSSNKGEDFRIVLEELIKIVEPTAVMPAVPQKGWNYADYYCGDGWSLAYRVLDAQYWGVPQRRRRIYLVLDLGGERAGEVLFKREGLRGYFTEGRTPWQAAPGDAENRTGTADCERECVAYGISPYHSNCMKSDNPHSGIYVADTARTLDAMNCGYPGCNQGGIAVVESIGFDGYNSTDTGDKAATLGVNCGMSTGRNGVCVPYTLKIRSGCEGGGKGALIQEDMSATLACNNDQYLFQAVVLDDQGGSQISVRDDGKCPTLRAEAHGHLPCVMEQYLFENHSQDSRYKGPLDVCPMLPAQLGTGGNNQPFVVKSTVYESHPMDSRIKELDETAPTVSVKWHKGAADTPLVCEPSISLASGGNVTGCLMASGYEKLGAQEMFSGDYTVVEKHPVYSLETFHCVSEEELTTTLKARDYKDPVCVAYGVDCRNATEYPELNGCIQHDTYKNLNSNGVVRIQYIVRRLTSTECARLQGFPDRWATPDQKDDFTDDEYRFWMTVRNTHAEINSKAVKEYTKAQMLTWYNKLHTDSAEYKLWGNGIALPTALYVMQGIAEVFK